MDEVADRLGREHAEKSVDWEALGHEDGKLWAQLASIKDFEELPHNLKVKERQGRLDNWIPSRWLEGTKNFNDRRYEHMKWFYEQYDSAEKTNHTELAETMYVRGWLSYVTAVWRMAKDRIAADSKARLEALRAKQASVELPDQLFDGQ